MTLSQIMAKADSIHYVRSVEDVRSKLDPEENFAHAMKALYMNGYYAFRSFNKNIVLINSIMY